MKRVCIISDTHGLLRDKVIAELKKSDAVIHAGDIGSDAVLQSLKQYGTLYAVRGNNDVEWAKSLPDNLIFNIEGIRFYLIHNKKDVPRDLAGIDIVIYGHSHKYEETESNGILFLNPGGCGKRRFHLELNMCRMIINGTDYQCEKVIIET